MLERCDTEGITLLRGRRRNDGLEMLRRCIAVVTGRGSDLGYLDWALTNTFFRPETVRLVSIVKRKTYSC